jgi:uncharacterized membrane protein
MAVFLVKRGLWLVFLELTVVNFAWFIRTAKCTTGTKPAIRTNGG